MSNEARSKFYQLALAYAQSLKKADRYSYAMDCMEGLMDGTGIPAKRSRQKLSATGTDYAEFKQADVIRTKMLKLLMEAHA